MHLTPREKDKLMVVVAADLARRRKERGVLLNYPESVALIIEFIHQTVLWISTAKLGSHYDAPQTS